MLFRIKDKLRPISVDVPVRRLSVASVFFNLATWALLFARIPPLIASGRLIALHYNVYLNVNNVGPAGFAFVLPAIGLIIIAINFWLAARSYGSSRANTLVILAVTVFYELLAFLSAFFLILINTFR